MDIEQHVPSLTHLREFTRASANGRATHVHQDRKQVLAPANDRIFAFAYEKFLTGVVNYVAAGNHGGALQRAVAEAPDRMRPSYEAAAKGMTAYIANLNPSGVSRRQRNVVVVDADGYGIVSLRVHLLFDVVGERVGAFMYFSEKPLTPPELAITETAVAMAVRQLDASAAPAIVFVRSGVQHAVDLAAALTDTRVRFLRAESVAYRQAWAVAD